MSIKGRFKLLVNYDSSLTLNENLLLSEELPSKMPFQPEKQVKQVKPNLYPCVPKSFQPFVNYVMINKPKLSKQLGVDDKTLSYLTKISLGIIGRETQMGEYQEKSDLASQAMREFGLGWVINAGLGIYNMYKQTKNPAAPKQSQSLGYGQFTPETWETYGLDKTIGDYDTSFSATKQGLGVLSILAANYKKNLSNGLPTTPSTNPILVKYNVIENIKGSGNNALDMAILAHNMGTKKTSVKWCTTNHPLYAGPCSESIFTPFKTIESFNQFLNSSNLMKNVTDQNLKKFPGKIKVNQSNVIQGYLPNLKSPSSGHSSIGYIEAVVKNSGRYNCF